MVGIQSTFGEISVREHSGRHSCNKVMGVENGEKIFCGNSAKYFIKKEIGKNEYRCGIHIKEFKAVMEGENNA